MKVRLVCEGKTYPVREKLKSLGWRYMQGRWWQNVPEHLLAETERAVEQIGCVAVRVKAKEER